MVFRSCLAECPGCPPTSSRLIERISGPWNEIPAFLCSRSIVTQPTRKRNRMERKKQKEKKSRLACTHNVFEPQAQSIDREMQGLSHCLALQLCLISSACEDHSRDLVRRQSPHSFQKDFTASLANPSATPPRICANHANPRRHPCQDHPCSVAWASKHWQQP